MKEHKITIAKREFPLAYTVGTLEKLSKSIEGFDETKIDEIIKSNSGMLDVLYALAQEGAIKNGTKLDVDRDWFGSHIPVNIKRQISLRLAITFAVVDGMQMESDDEEEVDREIDVVLEELKKKGVKTS